MAPFGRRKPSELRWNYLSHTEDVRFDAQEPYHEGKWISYGLKQREYLHSATPESSSRLACTGFFYLNHDVLITRYGLRIRTSLVLRRRLSYMSDALFPGRDCDFVALGSKSGATVCQQDVQRRTWI